MTDRERVARALQSALGEDLSAVLDRVTKVVEEVRAEEREQCAKKADAEKTWARSVVTESDGQDGKREHGYRCRAAAAHDIARDIRARDTEPLVACPTSGDV